MPDDTSPHGGEAMHELPDRAKIPQPKPGAEHGERSREQAERERPGDADVARRPALPDHPEPMAADVEDEEDDPVVESGPGVAEETGKPSVTRQPGEGS